MDHRPRQTQNRRKRGIALLLTLFAVAIASTLALSFLSAQSTSVGVARNIQNHPRARHIAESGLELAVAYVRANADWRTTQPNGTWVTNEAFGGGTFTVVGTDTDGDLADDANDPVTITVTGLSNGTSHIVLATLVAQGAGGSTPQFATTGSIRLKDNAVIDSFDSTLGAYGGANVSNNAVVGTNSTNNNIVRLQNDAVINGNVQIGPGGDPASGINTTQNGTITGTTGTLDTAVQIPAISAPPGMPANQGEVEVNSGTITWSSDQHFDRFKAEGSVIIEISGNVTVLVEEEFKLKGNVQLKILPGASLTLYAKDKVKFEGGALVNVNSADPSAFTINLIGNAEMELEDSAAVYATVNAPGGELKVKDTANFYGAFHGSEIKLEDSGQLHADVSSALAGAGGGGGGASTYQVAWQEP